jgi:Ring finger domain
MEQFNTLPEIKYMPNVDDSGDEDDENIDDSVDENNTSPAANEEEVEDVVDASKSQDQQTVVKKINDSDGGESSSSPDDDEFPTTLAQNTTDVTGAESMETEIARSPDTSIHESIEEDLELGDVKLKEEQEATKASGPEEPAAACDAANNTNNNANQNIAPDECSPAAESCSQASSCPKRFKPTTSSMCSICIDDFEEGESLILLPRCQHAFHKDCILPWLTERQGCCPTCKCNVLKEDDGDQEEAEEAGGGNDNDDDRDSTETNENHRINNVNLVVPEVVVAPPVPPQHAGTR